MTTPPVVSITDELVAELERLAAASSAASGFEEWIGEHDISGSLANQCDIDFVVKLSPATVLALIAERAELKRKLESLKTTIDTPHTGEWFEAVRLEAAHQINRWGTDHDAGKQPADWFWLLGYLGQKAMTAQMAGDEEKAKHHTISSGAMLLNWFRAISGDSAAMRPGIDAAMQK